MVDHPCSVCGNTERNLVDGNYYCTDCGTQDTNIKETILENNAVADGTFGLLKAKRISIAPEKTIKASGEVLKWHTFNCILFGLADELMTLGARPSFKMKLLWIWTRYIKRYQVKEQYGTGENQGNDTTIFDIEEEDENEEGLNSNKLDEELTYEDDDLARFKIKIVNKSVLLAILYCALNLDGSEIEISHLCRFVREGRLSLNRFWKFVPKEINTKLIPNFNSFISRSVELPSSLRYYAMKCFKKLKLGSPKMPDIRKIINTYIIELCLPNGICDLVFSLMDLVPCNFLITSKEFLTNHVRIPDYETFAMAYILIALKMCFGLDCDYEIKLSDAIERTNDEKKYSKSYKLGEHSETTDRLFSFREWSYYMQLRKMILCNYYLPMARKHNQDIDDHVLVGQAPKARKLKTDFSYELTMDLLNKLPNNFDDCTIPVSEFPASLTPLLTYTSVVLQYISDPDIRLILSEDFTQYSLEHPTHMKDTDNIYIGLSESNKSVHPDLKGYFTGMVCDFSLVYIRDCENKNWLKTNPPTIDHVKIVTGNDDIATDNAYESKSENSSSFSDNEVCCTNDTNFETIDEEDVYKGIFDDDFKGVNFGSEDEEINVDNDKYTNKQNDKYTDDRNDSRIEDTSNTNINKNIDRMGWESIERTPYYEFNPETLNSAQLIKELVLKACKVYKIPVPSYYKNKPRKPRKRKPNVENDQTEQRVVKKLRSTLTEYGRKDVRRVIAEYYDNLEKNLVNELSEHVKSVVQTLGLNQSENQQLYDIPSEPLVNTQTNLNDDSVCEMSNLNMEIADDQDEAGFMKYFKSDPKFDENVYDMKQLYVKINEDDELDNIFDSIVNDLEINKIIDEKLEQFKTGNKFIKVEDDDHANVTANSGAAKFVKRIDETIQWVKTEKEKEEITMQPLIKHPENIKKMMYWLKHYDASVVHKMCFCTKFELELGDNFPSSFSFVLHECAAILESPTLFLYLRMAKIEAKLLPFLKGNNFI